jgi:hypothetical protein
MPNMAPADAEMNDIKEVFEILKLSSPSARAPFVDTQGSSNPSASFRVVVSSSSDPFAK